jgi:hypothetical protein
MHSPQADTAPEALAEITEAARAYYRRAAPLQLTATDFFDWLELLPVATRAKLLREGFSTGRYRLDFLRHCLEVRGYSMRQHMMECLSIAAYEAWEKHYEFNGDLPDCLPLTA